MPQQFLYRQPQEYSVSRHTLGPGAAAEAYSACHGYAVLCVVQGVCRLDLGGRTLLVDGSSAVLLGPGVPSRLEVCGGAGAAMFVAEFSAAFVRPLDAMPDCDLTAFLCAEPVRLLAGLPAAAQRDLRALMARQAALCAQPDPLPSARAEGRLLLAALLLELEGLCATHHRRGDNQDLAEQLRRYIAAHYAEKLDLAVLSARFHTSRWHLCHAFKAQTGQSPIEYLHRMRVQAACALLREPEPLSLEEIARRCGCSGAAQLRRLFKAMTGQSPRQYRRQAPG